LNDLFDLGTQFIHSQSRTETSPSTSKLTTKWRRS